MLVGGWELSDKVFVSKDVKKWKCKAVTKKEKQIILKVCFEFLLNTQME